MTKQFKTVEIKVGDVDDEGVGQAVIATLNVVDKDGDVTLPGAFGNGQVVKVLPTHDWSSVPLGKATIREVGEQVVADFKLNMDIQAARDWHSALKFDLQNGESVQEWSYGFMISEAEMGNHNGERVRFLKGLKVHEISPVVVGAGEGTRTLAVKMAEELRQKEQEEQEGKGMKLSEQINALIDEAKDVLERVQQIREMRAQKDKDVSEENLENIGDLQKSLQHIAAELERCQKSVEQEMLDLVSQFEEFRLHTRKGVC